MPIVPNWLAPKQIHCKVFNSMYNLHPGRFFSPKRHFSNPHPTEARQLIQQIMPQIKPATLQLLHQTNSGRSCLISYPRFSYLADAGITTRKNIALAVYTADCLPIFLTCPRGEFVAVIHAGWRGLYHNIIKNTFQDIPKSTSNIMAWIGPSICKSCYEVSVQFKKDFTKKNPDSSPLFSTLESKTYFDCRGYATHQLKQLGVEQVYQTTDCTYKSQHLPSYRRSGPKNTARMLSTIWIADPV